MRIAISIGQDADDEVLREFTGNRELVLQANNAEMLVKMIKWASTAASVVSAPASRAADITPDAVDGAESQGTIVLDMDNIPTNSDVDVGDVW